MPSSKWLSSSLLFLVLHLILSGPQAAAAAPAGGPLSASDSRVRLTLLEEAAVGTQVGPPLGTLLSGSGGGAGTGGGPVCPGASRRAFSFSSDPVNPFVTSRFNLTEGYSIVFCFVSTLCSLLSSRLEANASAKLSDNRHYVIFT